MERLLDDGYASLREGKFRRARSIARALKAKRNSGAFEIEGRALWAMGKRDEAISVLEQGIRIAPSIRVLWDYLGEYYSNTGRFEEAIDAFERSKSCPYREPGTADYNIAIVLQRQGKHEEALRLLDAIPQDEVFGPPPRDRIEYARVFSLMEMNRFEEALEVIPSLLQGEVDRNARARLLSHQARATLRVHDDRAEAERLARKALQIDKTLREAHQTLREARAKLSERTRHVQLVIRGRENRMPRPWGTHDWFLVRYEVYAESLQAALGYVREFEGEEVCAELTVDEIIEQVPTPGEFTGVEWTDGAYIVSAPKWWRVLRFLHPQLRGATRWHPD